MAKGNESHITRIARTESHAEKVRLLFAQTVNKILALNKRMPELEKGIMYSFDGDTKKVQNQVDMLLRQLHSVATVAIENDIAVEWDIANEECDKLVASVFGKKALEGSSSYAGYLQRNKAALRAFTKRVEGGMNLSDRVWSSCRQLRDEMEIALTVAMGEGQSAQEISRSVRKYLNEPDLMFRRFRVKTGEEIIYDEVTGEEIGRKPIWGRKWKKRVKDDKTGKYKFIDYDRNSYIPKGAAREGIRGSQGVYKSSAKNAMRVARTETNMAYRMADHERWQQLDFVRGIHIEPTSHSAHGRVKDICDELQGDYPAWFVFEGWHPQCYCIATPILMSRSEMLAKAKAESEGKTYTFKEKRIEKLPDNFNDWVDKNAMKIVNSRDFGKDPYFVRHNWDAVNNIINPKAEPTTLEKAKIRHENRTPEQIADIQARADERQKRLAAEQHKIEVINKGASNVLSVADSRGFTKLGIDVSALQDAVKAGNTANIQQETRKVAKAMAQKQKQIRKQVENIKKAASDWQEVDVSAVESALASNNVFKMREQVKILAQDILSVRKQENALSDLIPDVHEWHKKFTLQELTDTHKAIQKTLNRWSWNFDSASDLNTLKKALEHEVRWMGTDGKGKKYATWEISQNAYKRKLALVEHRIEMLEVKTDSLASIQALSNSKSAVANQLVREFHAMFKDDATDIQALRNKALDIETKLHQLEHQKNLRLARAARKNRQNAAQSPASSSGPFIPKSDDETKLEYANWAKSIGANIAESDIVIDKGFVHMQGYQQRFVYNALKPETAQEHKQLWNHQAPSRWGAAGYVRTGNSFRINDDFRKAKIVGPIDSNATQILQSRGASADDLKTINLLDKKISEFSVPIPLRVTRFVGTNALESIFGEPIAGTTLAQIKKSILNSQRIIQSDPAFLSASLDEMQNVFEHNPIKLEIEVEPNTPFYLTDNYPESEVVFGRSTKLEFVGVEIKKEALGRSFRNMNRVVIRCRMRR